MGGTIFLDSSNGSRITYWLSAPGSGPKMSEIELHRKEKNMSFSKDGLTQTESPLPTEVTCTFVCSHEREQSLAEQLQAKAWELRAAMLTDSCSCPPIISTKTHHHHHSEVYFLFHIVNLIDFVCHCELVQPL